MLLLLILLVGEAFRPASDSDSLDGVGPVADAP